MKLVPYVWFATAFCLLAACSQEASRLTSRTASEASAAPAYVRIPLRHLTSELIATASFDRDHKYDDEFAFGYLPRAAFSRLPSEVFADLVELDSEAWAKVDFDPKTLLPRPNIELEAAEGDYEDYHDYRALTSELESLASAHPELAVLESAGRSVQGRELWYLKISDDVQADEDEPKLLYIANMHGDEVVGRELMIYLARHLLDGYATDERIKALVDHAQIYIMPSMNPDGFESRRRGNANFVDLNRNFPDFTTDPRDTSDRRAPETAAIMALHQRHHFVQALNFHGGEVCFNMPWDTQANTGRNALRFGDDPWLRQLGREYADKNATMRANTQGSFDRGLTYGYEWYEIDGGMQDWSIHYRGSIHATVELSYAKWPSASQLPRAWEENREAMLRYLEQGTFGVHLRVVDQDGQPIPSVTVEVGSLDRQVTYRGGFVHRPALSGEQEVRLHANGYETLRLTLEPWYFAEGGYKDAVMNAK